MARPSRARFLLGLVYLSLLVALLVLDVDPQRGRAWLLESGAWGLLAYAAAFSLLQPVGLASHLFVVTAALVWSPWIALGASWVGALGAGTVAFAFARYVGRDWVQQRMPAKLRGWDERLAAQGFRTVLVMRLLLFTFGPMQLLFGVSRVRYGPFVAASALGLVPMLAAETWLGGNVVAWLMG